jgi:hypothetical protein
MFVIKLKGQINRICCVQKLLLMESKWRHGFVEEITLYSCKKTTIKKSRKGKTHGSFV